MSDTVVLDGNCSLELVQDGGCSLDIALDGQFGTYTKVREVDYYEGETTFTPTEEQQVFSTRGLTMPANVVINAIPSNYGRLTWNGSVLTVS